ncbi:MAG: serine/threonine protein kinase [Gammaproteobacteria bacterium]|nr:serine/threonine protein kinase [Gammaproteobacteria bacterium]
MSAGGSSSPRVIIRPSQPSESVYRSRPTKALDAFQGAFAGYLACTISLEQFRAVVAECVDDTYELAKVFGNSIAAAFSAHCVPPEDYRVLQADLANLPRHKRARRESERSSRALRGRFLIQKRVAVGGVGILYRALDRRREELGYDNAMVAIKMLGEQLRRSPEALRSLQCEVRNARRLDHPNIRKVFELDRCRAGYFITMEWLEGESLAIRLDRTGSRAMPAPAAFAILAEIAAGLMHAHERGIVHGDMKPGNVFVTTEGRVKLLDFGQAYSFGATPGLPAGPAISPAYASCELHEGARPEFSDDIFALAVMAYRMLAGARPFGRYSPPKAEEAGIRVLRPAGLDERQWRMLQRGLAWRREDRPLSVREFIHGILPHPAPERQPGKENLHVAA